MTFGFVFKKYLLSTFNLVDTTDYENTSKAIKEGVAIKGYNLWFLISSALLACIGLNVSSPAVIIGAMLVSPLMSPIIGIGFAVATVDSKLLFSAARNLGLAIVLSLGTAIIYFSLSPITEATPEILSRTHPNFLDVLVAFFGGIAGVVAISRKGITNAIPGVAIATALMPPLCTAGYGMAQGSMPVLFGALYLFLINTIFISLSCFLLVKLLAFPEINFENKRFKQRSERWFLVFALVFVSPSFYFFYTAIEKQTYNKQISLFMANELPKNNFEVLKWKVEGSDSSKTLKIFLLNQYLDSVGENNLALLLDSKYAPGTKLKIIKPNEFTRNNLTLTSSNELEASFGLLNSKQQLIDSLQQIITSRNDRLNSIDKMNEELNILFPKIQIGFIEGKEAVFVSNGLRLSNTERKTITLFIQKRYGSDSLEVRFGE